MSHLKPVSGEEKAFNTVIITLSIRLQISGTNQKVEELTQLAETGNRSSAFYLYSPKSKFNLAEIKNQSLNDSIHITELCPGFMSHS